MDTKEPKQLGKEIGKRQWHTARVKGFLGEPPRRFRLVRPSLSEYIDGRLERIDLPDPLPPVTGKDNHRGTIVWGRRTWDLPAGPGEARDVPPWYLDDREAAWIQTYRAVRAAVGVGLYHVGTAHTRRLTDPVQIKEGGETVKRLARDAVAVCSARPLSEDEDGRVPSYLADVVDATLYTIHRRAVDRQIQRARSHYRHAPVTPAVDRQTGEILNIDALESEPRLDATCPA
jgi:hypothetical protein